LGVTSGVTISEGEFKGKSLAIVKEVSFDGSVNKLSITLHGSD
jgi:hypothetical protein